MSEFARELLHVNLEDEMKQSYLDYAMSVIVGRALPDVRDGLKPVHRRVLYAMYEQNNDWNRAYKKSARVVGDVMGKYHPHGDSAIYDTMVRMAQPFSLRYMLVDGQGNFGSVDGDSAAAMRYTEVRMAKISHQLLADLDKETVDFVPNYDGSEHEPGVLPSRVPNLLVNGSAGIAVGMATNIPPHNLGEVLNATVALIDDPDISIDGLIEHIPGPDFPTAGIVNGAEGIHEAYRTGRGKLYMRARSHVETDESNGKQSLIVTELPYQVNKARLIKHIADLVKDKKLEGITGIVDLSDKDGMRMMVELRRGEVPEVVLNNLYQQTAMQSVFGINTVALVDGQPKTLNLKQVLEAFVRHRREVVTRRTIYLLRKARGRAHELEGLAIALANIDEVIKLIRAAKSPAEAREGLLSRTWQAGVVTALLERAGANASRPDDLEAKFGLQEDGGYRLSPAQVKAILELRLHRLTGLEQDKIVDEYKELLETIADLLDILHNPDRLLLVIRDELLEIREQFGDERRTEIRQQFVSLSVQDLVPDESVIVTLSHAGYVKAQQLDTYQAQKRGGRGKAATKNKQEDFVDKLFVAETHDTLLCFSTRGRMYWLKVYMLPQGGRGSRGKPIVNLLPLEGDERITAVLPVREYPDTQYVFMATRNGTVKKTALSAFSRPRNVGIIAVDLRDDDELVNVALTDGNADVMLMTTEGKAVRFPESAVRQMGRTAGGVRGVRLAGDAKVISLIVVGEGTVLTVTANGYGKRTLPDDFPVHGRGGQGVIAMQTSERNGALVGAVQVLDDDEIMLITDGGTLIRTAVEQISVLSRNTQGVRVIRVDAGETLIAVEPVARLEDEVDLPEGDDDAAAEGEDAAADHVPDVDDDADEND